MPRHCSVKPARIGFYCFVLTLVGTCLVLAACVGGSKREMLSHTAIAGSSTPALEGAATSVPPLSGESTVTPSVQMVSQATPVPEQIGGLEPALYNLPSTRLTSATGLYASPNRSELITPVPIPEGETVFVIGKNKIGSHLRVVWNTDVGWIPVSFTDYSGQRGKMNPLPVLRDELPARAEPVTILFRLDSTWTSDRTATLIAVVNLFQHDLGKTPPSSIALTLNGAELEGYRYEVGGQGRILLNDVQLVLPKKVDPGDVIGFHLDTVSAEPLMLVATLYTLPSSGWTVSEHFPFSDFAIFYRTERPGEQLSETVSYEDEAGLDNSSGTAPLQVQIQFERTYRYQIIERISSNEISGQSVRDRIVELYKLPPNDPEGSVQTALCPVSVVIPPGQKAKITVEWTERWAEGVIQHREEDGEFEELGDYQVFLGYYEPCSLVEQKNIR